MFLIVPGRGYQGSTTYRLNFWGYRTDKKLLYIYIRRYNAKLLFTHLYQYIYIYIYYFLIKTWLGSVRKL